MEIVQIKCPACGATPEMNKDMEFGFCMYCGTKIYIPNAIQRIQGTVTIDKNNEIDNLLKRAYSFEQIGDYDKADEYYDRILDIDINNKEIITNYPSIMLERAKALEAKQDYFMAEKYFEKCHQLAPEMQIVSKEYDRFEHNIVNKNIFVSVSTKQKTIYYRIFRVVDGKYEELRNPVLPIGTHTISVGGLISKGKPFQVTIDSIRTQVYVSAIDTSMAFKVIKHEVIQRQPFTFD